MSLPTVNGMLSETVDETRSRLMAVNRGRRSGFARVTILRKDDTDTARDVAGSDDETGEAGKMRGSQLRRVELGSDDDVVEGVGDGAGRAASVELTGVVPRNRAWVGGGNLALVWCGTAARARESTNIGGGVLCTLYALRAPASV